MSRAELLKEHARHGHVYRPQGERQDVQEELWEVVSPIRVEREEGVWGRFGGDGQAGLGAWEQGPAGTPK